MNGGCPKHGEIIFPGDPAQKMNTGLIETALIQLDLFPGFAVGRRCSVMGFVIAGDEDVTVRPTGKHQPDSIHEHGETAGRLQAAGDIGDDFLRSAEARDAFRYI